MESDYLTLQETADLLGKSTQTVRRLIKKGDLQAQRLQTPQGFQYAVLRSSLTSRFVRLAPVQNQAEQNPPATSVDTDWSKFLPPHSASQNEPAKQIETSAPKESPEVFLENDYYLFEPSPLPTRESEDLDRNSVSSRQLLEFAQAAHKEKLMLITILERLQAELECERRRPKSLIQWIGSAAKSVSSLFKKTNRA